MCIIKYMGKITEVGQQNHGDSCGTRKRLLFTPHIKGLFFFFFSNQRVLFENTLEPNQFGTTHSFLVISNKTNTCSRKELFSQRR